MPYIRKIDKPLWLRTNSPDVAADAITNCLRTNKDALSLWRIDDSSDDAMKDAYLAIASTFTAGLDTFDVVVFENSIIEDNFEIVKSITNTPYLKMVNNHYDLVGLTSSSLIRFSNEIYNVISENLQKRITKAQIKGIFREFIDSDASFIQHLHTSISGSL